MEQFPKYDLRKINSQIDEYELILYLDEELTEFGAELGRQTKKRKDVVTAAKQIISTQYPNVKVTMVKVLLGGLVISSIHLGSGYTSTAQAAEQSTQGTVNNISYQVSSGDTLWSISQKFNISVNAIKQSNNLTSDILSVGQVLKIPSGTAGATGKATSHIVEAGDSLWSIATKFGTTVPTLKQVNNLTSDFLQIGQKLNIPTDGTNTNPNPPAVPNTPTVKVTSHNVEIGETLYGIATRYGVTVDQLKKANQLTTNFLQIGQTLTIPMVTQGTSGPAEDKPSTHTVQAGETLWAISSRYGISVNDLQAANSLQSTSLQIGQTLTIPTGKTQEKSPPVNPPVVEEKRSTFIYSVVSGDSLSAIAKRFDVTVDAIRTTNKLKSDNLQLGQALTIPNGLGQNSVNTISYKTHTIVSGDNIWDLSIRYGIPQAELLRANNLTTSSRLSLGQKLIIPVHTIASKQVVSEKHGEYLDWWTEAQYVFSIGKTAKVTDVVTGKSFYIKRTIGANHADSETLSVNDSNIAKSIWGGFSWTPRAVIVEVDGRKLAGSMSFMPHEREYIMNNGITGHFDVYFGNSTRHVDGKADASHQAKVEIAAGIR